MSSSPVSKVEFLDKTTCSVSVVICAYSMSRLEILLAAVDAATVQANGPGDEVVVVIDHNESMLAHVRAHVPTGSGWCPTLPSRACPARETAESVQATVIWWHFSTTMRSSELAGSTRSEQR